jgi:hypothetical protein
MTTGTAGGLKNREPFKADSTGGHLEKVFDRMPGRGKDLLRKNHKAFFRTTENKS